MISHKLSDNCRPIINQIIRLITIARLTRVNISTIIKQFAKMNKYFRNFSMYWGNKHISCIDDDMCVCILSYVPLYIISYTISYNILHHVSYHLSFGGNVCGKSPKTVVRGRTLNMKPYSSRLTEFYQNIHNTASIWSYCR